MQSAVQAPKTRLVEAVVDHLDHLSPATRTVLLLTTIAAAVALLVMGGLVLTNEPSGPGQQILVPQ